ncbi:hypothetical protein VaNZ11_003762, partial [Volvox africanus]
MSPLCPSPIHAFTGAVGGQDTPTPKGSGKPLRSPPPPPDPNLPTFTLTGEIKYVDTHDGHRTYTFYDAEGNVTPLARDLALSDVDNKTVPISAGDVLQLECVVGRVCSSCPSGENATCTCPSEEQIQGCLSTNQATVSQVVPAWQVAQMDPNNPNEGTAINKNYRLLVLILDYTACGFAPSLDVDTVTQLYMGPNGDGNGGVAEKFKQCSYGKFNISYFQVAVIKPVCSTAVTGGCSWWAISSAADAAAKAQLGLPFFSNFTYYTYVVPPGLQSVCPWAGLALVPGKQTWLQSTGYGVLRWATIMQE